MNFITDSSEEFYADSQTWAKLGRYFPTVLKLSEMMVKLAGQAANLTQLTKGENHGYSLHY